MRENSAVLGIAAAAALSSAASALPCAKMSPATSVAASFSCTAYGGNSTSSVDARDPRSVPPNPTGPMSAELELLGELAAPVAAEMFSANVTEGAADTFSADRIKITNLQATMTANKYVVGFPNLTPARLTPTDDLTIYGPDYLSVKALPPLPKNRPSPVVGVGLVTAPSKDANKSATTPNAAASSQSKPQPEHK